MYKVKILITFFLNLVKQFGSEFFKKKKLFMVFFRGFIFKYIIF